MRPETAKYLHDVLQACALLESFTQGKSFDDYRADALLRAGVEREFITIGEALLQASKLEPALAQAITALPQIIAFRNVLVHSYAAIQHQTVWGVLQNELAILKQEVTALLASLSGP